MNKPYIGITGIENSNQLERILTIYSQKGDIPHLLMVGEIVSYKTLIDVKDKPIVLMKNETRCIFEELKKQDSENVLLAWHYFTKPLGEVRPELKEKTRRVVEKSLSQQISELFENIYGEYERTQPPFQIGVQINVSWPEPREVNQIKIGHSKLKTILQVSDFTSLEDRIRNYNVDYILIDTSRGEGLEFDINEAIKVHNIISKNNPATIGFAGGFSPKNVRERVGSIKRSLDTKDFCIDAQGRLRTGKYLDMDKAERYLKEAIEAFKF